MDKTIPEQVSKKRFGGPGFFLVLVLIGLGLALFGPAGFALSVIAFLGAYLAAGMGTFVSVARWREFSSEQKFVAGVVGFVFIVPTIWYVLFFVWHALTHWFL